MPGAYPTLQTHPDPSTFDKRTCSLLLIEVGFGSDLNLRAKIDDKTKKYQPLITELQKDWGYVNLIYIPIGHAGAMLGESAHHLAAAMATRRPSQGPKPSKTTIDRHALQHDTKTANRLLQQLSDLAAKRLLQIPTHCQAEIVKLKPDDPPPFLPRRRGIDPSPDFIP